MKGITNLIDQKFGRLIVLKFSHENKWNEPYWFCRCDCGNEKIINGSKLRSGNTRSCGCYRRERISETVFKNLTNQKFGRWIVLEVSHKDKWGTYHWRCQCECGNKKTVCGSQLRDGGSISCGCYNRERTVMCNSGKDHPGWRGGKSFEPYPGEWSRSLKKFIRNRDQHKCRYPECLYDDTKEQRKLSIHHIDSDKNNCRTWNLISLCHHHHMKIERNHPISWQQYFYQITGDYE